MKNIFGNVFGSYLLCFSYCLSMHSQKFGIYIIFIICKYSYSCYELVICKFFVNFLDGFLEHVH